MKDYYKILQIHPEASPEVMNNAYRTLVRQYHPDLYHTQRKDRMNDKMREINEAYQVLSNAQQRADYDRKYQKQPPAAANPKAFRASDLKKFLIWSVGGYLFARYLLVPVLANPLLKLILLGGLVYLAIRFYRNRKMHS